MIGLVLLLPLVPLVLASNITIGLLGSETGVFALYGSTIRPSAYLWQDYIIRRGGIANTGIMPNLIFYDVESDPIKTAELTGQLITQGADIIIGPETYLTGITAAVAQASGVPVITGMAATSDIFLTASGERRFPRLYGVMTPGVNYFDGFLDIARLTVNVAHVGILWLDQTPNNDVCQGAAARARALKIAVTTWVVNSSLSSEMQLDAMDQGLSYLQQEVGPSGAVITCNYMACAQTLLQLAAIGYSPAMLGMFECISYLPQLMQQVGELVKFIYVPVQWDYRLQGDYYSDDPERDYANMFPVSNGQSSALQFYLAMNKTLAGAPMSSLAPSQLAALYTAESGVACANSTDKNKLNFCLRATYMKTYYGIVNPDQYGQDSLRTIVTVQVGNNYEVEIVDPLDSATARPIAPMPAFDQRHYNYMVMSSASEIGNLVYVVVNLLLAVATSGFIIKNRQDRHIKAISCRFSVVILAGYGLTCVATTTWTANDNQGRCIARLPMFWLGLSLMICPLVAKTARVAYIFNSRDLKVAKIGDGLVAQITVSLMLVLAMPVVGWILGAPLTSRLVVVDPLRPSTNYYQCQTGDLRYLYACLALLFVMLAAAGVAGVLTRSAYAHEDLQQFNESFSVVIAIYWLIASIVVIIGVSYSFESSNPGISFIAHGVGLQFVAMSAMVILFTHHLLAVGNIDLVHTIGTRASGSGSGERGLKAMNSGTGDSGSGSGNRAGSGFSGPMQAFAVNGGRRPSQGQASRG